MYKELLQINNYKMDISIKMGKTWTDISNKKTNKYVISTWKDAPCQGKTS